MKLDLFMITAL